MVFGLCVSSNGAGGGQQPGYPGPGAPEAAAGGPLAAVRNGDRIRMSVEHKRIDLLVDDAEIRRRLLEFTPPPAPSRGYKALYRRSVLQAPDGCDFDFLTGSKASGSS